MTEYLSVNGINITIPASTPFEANIGGTPGNTVTVTGATSIYIVRGMFHLTL